MVSLCPNPIVIFVSFSFQWHPKLNKIHFIVTMPQLKKTTIKDIKPIPKPYWQQDPDTNMVCPKTLGHSQYDPVRQVVLPHDGAREFWSHNGWLVATSDEMVARYVQYLHDFGPEVYLSADIEGVTIPKNEADDLIDTWERVS